MWLSQYPFPVARHFFLAAFELSHDDGNTVNSGPPFTIERKLNRSSVNWGIDNSFNEKASAGKVLNSEGCDSAS